MKKRLKRVLQRLLGLHAYLVLHGVLLANTIRFRSNEGGILQLIRRLQPDACVLDIGANVGAMTLLLARKCRKGRVYGFEPIPENFHAAQTLLRLLRVHNAQLFEYALGDREETVEMVTPDYNGVTMSGLSYVVTAAHPRRNGGAVYRVPLVPLDSVATLRNARIDAMKIDVEEHEQYVLRGARETIERNRPIIYCELWAAENRQNVMEFLKELHYVPYVATNRRLCPYEENPRAGINF